MIKIILRNLIKSGKYTVLNITGLIIGLTLTILIVMLLNYEISFDGFHKNANTILCIVQHDLKDGSRSTTTPYPLPNALKRDFPEVKAVAGFNPILHEEVKLQYNNLDYKGFTGASVSSDVFSVFNYTLLLGNIGNVLDAPDKIVISENTAQKIFGTKNPVGEAINIEGFPMTISGIFADLPKNSDVNFDILFSEKINALLWEEAPKAWWASNISTFVILNDGVSVSAFNDHLKKIPDTYYPDFLKGRSTYFATAFRDLHFDTSLHGSLVNPVSPKYLVILGLIGFLTLMIACFNFINLTTAQATKRNIDAGIRRISGATPYQIIKQHLISSSITLLVSVLIALPLSSVCIPLFEPFVNREIASQISNPNVWIGIAGISILLALISGFIPGKIFSDVNPIRILRNKGMLLKSPGSLRSGFIVFQFSLVITLIISQLFIFKQIAYMKNTDLGFDYNNLTAIDVGNIEADYTQKYNKVKVFKNELERHSAEYGLSKGSVTENIPGHYYQNSFSVFPMDAIIDECLVVSTAVDENFVDLYKISLLHGRFFSEKHKTDRSAFVINETAMHRFGWTDIEGKMLKLSHEGQAQPVVGVIKDITETSLREETNPMIFRFGQHNNFPSFLSYRIDSDKKEEALAFMNGTWNELFSGTPFIHLNVKDTYFKNYESEQELAEIVSIFSGLAILLTILGLLGIISFTSELRTKEIGVRKVNGAKIREVMAMLNEEYLKWIAIAFVIATPIAWFAINKWLANFAFKTNLSWWVFALAGALALGIALLTVSWQSWRAATRNPVEALRYE